MKGYGKGRDSCHGLLLMRVYCVTQGRQQTEGMKQRWTIIRSVDTEVGLIDGR